MKIVLHTTALKKNGGSVVKSSFVLHLKLTVKCF